MAWFQGTRGDRTSSCQQQVLSFIHIQYIHKLVLQHYSLNWCWAADLLCWLSFRALSPSWCQGAHAGPGFVRSLALIYPALNTQIFALWPPAVGRGLTLIMFFSIHANSCLTSAGCILFLNQETDLIKVTGGLAQQRQVCCLWHKKTPNNTNLCWFRHFLLVLWILQSYCPWKKGDHIWFPTSLVFCLFVSEEKQYLFYKWYDVLQMSCEDSVWEKCL